MTRELSGFPTARLSYPNVHCPPAKSSAKMHSPSFPENYRSSRYSGHDTRSTNAVEREGQQGEQGPITSGSCQSQDRALGSRARAAGRSSVYDLLNPIDIDEESPLSSIASQSPTQPVPGPSTLRYQCDTSPQSTRGRHRNPSRNASPGSSQQVHPLQNTLPHRPESAPTTGVEDINSRWRQYLEGTSMQARCVYPVTSKDTGQEVACGYTGRTHATKRHIETIHLKIKRFQCPRCHTYFSQKASLERHINTHTGQKPYMCPYPGCPKSFGDRARLHRHKVEKHDHVARKPRRQKLHKPNI